MIYRRGISLGVEGACPLGISAHLSPKAGKNINYCLHVPILFSVKPCIY